MRLYVDYFEEEKSLSPYGSMEELITEALHLLDLLLESYLDKKGGYPENGVLSRGLVVTDDEIRSYLETPAFLREAEETDPLLSDQVRLARSHMDQRVKLTKEHAPDICTALWDVRTRFSLSEFEYLCVLLAFAIQHDLKYTRLFVYLQDDITKKMPTVGLAVALDRLYENTEPHIPQRLFEPEGKMVTFFFEEHAPKNVQTGLSAPLILRKQMLNWLLGADLREGEGTVCYAPKISGLPVFFDQNLQQLLQLSRKETAGGEQTDRFVYLEGKPGDGRTVLAAQYAEQTGKQLLVLEFPVLVGMTPEQAGAQICDVLTLLCITDSILLIRGCTEPLLMTEAARMLFSRCLKHAAGWKVLLSGEPIESHSLYKTQLYRIDRLIPGVHTRFAMWQLFAKGRVLDPQISLEELADCYELSVGTIARILQQAGMDADAQGAGAISRPVLLAAVNRMNTVHFGTLATRIRTVYTWDDLELPAAGKQVLMVACNRYKMRNRIGEDWGLASKNAYGNGVSVLLYGPPGTGKTMAAQVIANEIGMELYRIDLSQIVSKYIGETQKNMSAVFEEAQKANVVLFFDEADALFSKRTEVNNSNDKYANSETAYLLQKVEEYKGVSILATNLYNNFDSAFVRRLTYAVRFENPDEQTRYRLWTTTLPSLAPFAPDIDFHFLAENFELTGSNIKAILYSAAYMAAADGGVIMECHIARAMKYEFEKLGKMYQRGDFGKFAIYLQ